MKVVVYMGTRNVYKNMAQAIKSLLLHTQIDKIYFLIEDNVFPYELPPIVECINISNQTWIDKKSPNYNNHWSYIVLLRPAYSKIFPDLDIILSLDNDTIIEDDISDLWNIDMTDYYFAGVREKKLSEQTGLLYLNSGVLLFNLKKLREDKKDDELIYKVNNYYYQFPEQDCINKYCQDHLLEIKSDYNINMRCPPPKSRKIIHYIDCPNKLDNIFTAKYDYIEKNPGLDVIIPTYKNYHGLDKTLKSVYHEEIFKICKQYNFPIQITVIDDKSELDYNDLQEKYPKVNFIYQEKNQGPGVARQTGIDNTKLSHILFIDTGDYMLSKYTYLEIVLSILEDPTPYEYRWRWLIDAGQRFSNKIHGGLHGVVYSRKFITSHYITFGAEASYSNEDVGFNKACKLIVKELSQYDMTTKMKYFEAPIIMYVCDENSITRGNNKSYMYKKQLRGLAINMLHAVDICVKNKISKKVIWDEVSHVMVRLYYDFLFLTKNNKDLDAVHENWLILKRYYFDAYKKFFLNDFTSQQASIRDYMHSIKDLGVKHVNFQRFINDVENKDEVPDYYFDFE